MFYVTDECGKEFCKGRRFETQEEAERAALKSVKISTTRLINDNAQHKTARSCAPTLCIVEAIPGNHKTRAYVTADGVERK